ncbi:hypothetical protein Psuf_093300 [Phytohabitans suffuscus]|uniref:Uncharacterized protein n=1 Tax=Phytohabitans suffuscus TaxID=624315 RepID=A0A6F8Z0V0_9ACTN|nr:hypothetical protein Psuf_093300 [Phytohabitans suffuscus]
MAQGQIELDRCGAVLAANTGLVAVGLVGQVGGAQVAVAPPRMDELSAGRVDRGGPHDRLPVLVGHSASSGVDAQVSGAAPCPGLKHLSNRHSMELLRPHEVRGGGGVRIQ